MTAIWFILAFMTGAAVLALLWPLTRRPKPQAQAGEPEGLATQTGFYEDQLAEIERDLARGLIAPAEAESARAEAARRLLRASREEAADHRDGPHLAEPHLRQRRAAAAFALSTVPLVALVVYGLYGSPNMPSQTEDDRKAAQAGGQDLMKAIGQIEARLASHPDDARGWEVLAPVYMRLGRFDEAARAFAAVARLKGENATILSDWGEALVAANDGNVPPEARTLFDRAVAADPKAPKPQFYLARADELAGNLDGAIRRLAALEAQGPADASWMGGVRDSLARLKAEAGKPAGETKPTPDTKPDAPAAGPAANLQALPPSQRMDAIRGMVEGLDRRLAKQGGTPEEWARLVRSYGALDQPDKAREALERGRAALSGDTAARESLEAQVAGLGLSQVQPPRSEPPPGPARIDPEAAAAMRAMPEADREKMIRDMVAGLDRRLSAKGGSVDEWMRLVRSYNALGDRPAATQALDRAKMALAADRGAAERLDALARELDLKP
ncbi:c-type cytochrome biogenesis protein CcmI [Methylobacterium organophilum]|uniref:c-type cytochrome biogenesis protein CcmI n=1 Tax=Methylobacterium organophilum TaxID=410 RepID=UPI001F146B0C|nr:c-type cytochrome biogenesis protein CcmI [Methylobacterium organophilum]UMY18571.1 c-type cytochrome biogenesis protein CcmI [Methylobacterium organophilum]